MLESVEAGGQIRAGSSSVWGTGHRQELVRSDRMQRRLWEGSEKLQPHLLEAARPASDRPGRASQTSPGILSRGENSRHLFPGLLSAVCQLSRQDSRRPVTSPALSLGWNMTRITEEALKAAFPVLAQFMELPSCRTCSLFQETCVSSRPSQRQSYFHA